MMSTKKKKVYLTLEQRVAAIKMLEHGRSAQSVADHFGCGRTQIQDCKKRKAELMTDYESNVSSDRKRHKPSLGVNDKLEELMCRWISDANSRRIGLTGALIQDRARLFASELDMSDFKASNGWLEKFLKRNNLVSKVMSGERGDVNQNNVSDWMKRLPDICEGYDPRDIFNMDETGIFFKLGKRSTFCDKDLDCAGGKKAKDRISVALCASMMGEKMKPLVIGRSSKPRCFRKIKVESLPVTYRNNKKAWMNRLLFDEWVGDLNKKMKRQNRHIILFLDNASSHSEPSLTHVKIVKLPANTTSVLQPMDQGIIQAVKLKFYKQQSQHVINQMEKTTLCGSDLLKSITVLDTIYWINNAWKNVDQNCIQRCFEKSGFSELSKTQPSMEDDASSDEEDDDIPLALLARAESLYGHKLLDIVNTEVEACDPETIDWNKPVSEILNDYESDSDSDPEPEVDEPCISMCEGGVYLERLKVLASNSGNVKFLTSIMESSSLFTDMKINTMTVQKKISDFFK